MQSTRLLQSRGCSSRARKRETHEEIVDTNIKDRESVRYDSGQSGAASRKNRPVRKRERRGERNSNIEKANSGSHVGEQ